VTIVDRKDLEYFKANETQGFIKGDDVYKKFLAIKTKVLKLTCRALYVVVLLASLVQTAYCQNLFAKIKYDSIVAYNYALHDSRVHAILKKDSTLDKSTVLSGPQDDCK
jgi:hypothetical protein